jgi:hypothetical protein
MGGTATRIAVLAAWAGGLVLLATWSDTTPALIAAAAATVAVGAIVGRWWALLVPTVAAVIAIVALLADGRDPGEYWDSDPEDYAYAYFVAWAIVAGLLAVGIAARKLVDRGRQRRLSASMRS